MKIKQTLSRVLAVVVLSIATLSTALIAGQDNIYAANQCGSVDTAIIACSGDDGKNGVESSGMWSLLLMAITILTAGVGVAALGGIVWGAVLYTSAGGNPEQVKKAVGIFTNVAIGVIAFAGMYVLLNFIIPGGIFN